MIKGIAAAIGAALLAVPLPADDVAPDQWLKAQAKPRFRESGLLPGPDKHRWSKDQPAYEFPAGAGARVLARRHARRPEWLATAWAADGNAREVAVEIPDLGAVKLQARPEGSVYRGGKAKLVLLEERKSE